MNLFETMQMDMGMMDSMCAMCCMSACIKSHR